jgi:hypothetical protein
MLLLTVSINYYESDYLLLFSLLEFVLWLTVTALLISVPKMSSRNRQTRTRFNCSGVSTRSEVLVFRAYYILHIHYLLNCTTPLCVEGLMVLILSTVS